MTQLAAMGPPKPLPFRYSLLLYLCHRAFTKILSTSKQLVVVWAWVRFKKAKAENKSSTDAERISFLEFAAKER